jgi:hypothetical protein
MQTYLFLNYSRVGRELNWIHTMLQETVYVVRTFVMQQWTCLLAAAELVRKAVSSCFVQEWPSSFHVSALLWSDKFT